MPFSETNAALAFGLSGLEATLYVALLRHGPHTGYGAAKLTKKPVANCYKSLESLAEKGAVVASHGSTVVFSATEPAELARTLSSSYGSRVQDAASTLSKIGGAEVAGDVFRISDPHHAIEKARSMLARASDLVLIDAFPGTLASIARDVNDISERGVRVLVKAYSDSSVIVTQLIKTPNAQSILDRWPGQWLIIVVDGGELLMALFDKDLQSLLQGMWTKSPYLAWIYHYSLASEFMLTALQALAATDPAMSVSKAISMVSSTDVVSVTGYEAIKTSWSHGSNR